MPTEIYETGPVALDQGVSASDEIRQLTHVFGHDAGGNIGRQAVGVGLSAGNTAAANGAILARAIALGLPVVLPSGRFPMQASITEGCTLIFQEDTVLLQQANAAALDIDLSGDALGPIAVSAITTATQPESKGASTNKVVRLTVPDASLFAIGDAVMLSSQDARSYYTTNVNYAGESARVAFVDEANDYVYVDGIMNLFGTAGLFPSPTSLVVYRLSRQTVRLVRPQVEANGDVYVTGLEGSWPGSIQVKAVDRLIVDGLRVNSAWGIGLYLKTCTAPDVRLDWIRDCPGDPDNNRYGYGVLLRGAINAGRVHGGVIERTRHGVTTDCREAASYAASNVWDHGDATDLAVFDITAIGNFAPPFDTHENSIGTVFRNCRAIGARYGLTGPTHANGAGFNLRGPWDSVIDCDAIDCEFGVNIAATSIAHEIVGENIVSGFRFWGEATNNLASYAITVEGDAGETTPQRVAITRMRPSLGSRFLLIEANFTGKVTIADCIVRGFYDTQIRVQGACVLDIVRTLFDMGEANTGESCILVDNSNTVTAAMAHCAVRSKNGTTPAAIWNVSSGATLNLRHLSVGELTANSVAMSAGAGTINKTAITALT